MECRKCKSTNLGVKTNKKNPKATDLYCKDCGAWQKFASKDEVRFYEGNNNIIKVTEFNLPKGCHCKDCKYSNAGNHHKKDYLFCDYRGCKSIIVKDDDFCSLGEKKDK